MEAISAKFDATKVPSRDAFCETHGTFSSKHLLGRWTVCPKCAQMDHEHLKLDALRRQRVEHEQTIMAKRAALTGISPRHIRCSFENYQVCASSEVEAKEQESALHMAMKYARNFKRVREDGTSLVFSGNVGTGKNHLACAIINHIIAEGFSARIVTATGMLRSIKESFREGFSQESVISDLVAVDLLVMDELSAWSLLPDDARLIFEIINRRSEMPAPTIMIANGSVEDLKAAFGNLEKPIFDRMRQGGGRVIDFRWDSYRAKTASKARWLMDEDPASADIHTLSSGLEGKR